MRFEAFMLFDTFFEKDGIKFIKGPILLPA
jgi:hypothetical protein